MICWHEHNSWRGDGKAIGRLGAFVTAADRPNETVVAGHPVLHAHRQAG